VEWQGRHQVVCKSVYTILTLLIRLVVG